MQKLHKKAPCKIVIAVIGDKEQNIKSWKKH